MAAFELQKVDSRILDVYGVVFGLQDEGGRCLVGGVYVGIWRHVFGCVGQIAGIDDEGEVGPATKLIGGVDGIVQAFVKVSTEALLPDAPRRKSLERRRDWGRCAIRRRAGEPCRERVARPARLRLIWDTDHVGHTILHQDAGHIDGVEPVANLGAFEIDGEDLVTTSRKDNDSRRCGAALGRIKRQGRTGHVAQTNQRLASNEIVGGLGGVDFRWRVGRAPRVQPWARAAV